MSAALSHDVQPAIEAVVSRIRFEQHQNTFMKRFDVFCVIALSVALVALSAKGVPAWYMLAPLGIMGFAAIRRQYRAKKLRAVRAMWASSIGLVA